MKQFPVWVLAILAEDPAAKNDLLHCLRALSFPQFAAALPMLDRQTFAKAMLLWKQPEQKLDILSRATVKQKKLFIDYMEKAWVQKAYSELQKKVHDLLNTTLNQAEKTTAGALFFANENQCPTIDSKKAAFYFFRRKFFPIY